MVEVAGKPIIDHILDWLCQSDVRQVVLAAGWGFSALAAHVAETWGRRIPSVALSIETQPLGTAGAAALAWRSCLRAEGGAWVLNGDNLTQFNLVALAGMVGWTGWASMALVPLRLNRGMVHVLADGRVTSFEEKPILEGAWCSGGTYWMEENALRALPEKGDLERNVFPWWAAEGKLWGLRTDLELVTVDSYKDLTCACMSRVGVV
jgi:NDP-sugar pyrophosphorylase family protein